MPEITIRGIEGRLEAIYQQGTDPSAPTALILHSHPEHGGHMNDKVTYALARTFAHCGFNTLRFNFRGIGNSEGKFSDGGDELSDAAFALDWLQSDNPKASSCWVAGFSFGALVAHQLLLRRPHIEGFICVSLPAHKYEKNFISPFPASGLLVRGECDSIVPPKSVSNLIQRLSSLKGATVDECIVPEADHFFTNKLESLVLNCSQYIQGRTSLSKIQAA